MKRNFIRIVFGCFISFLVTFVVISCSEGSEEYDSLYPVLQNGKWGYVDKSGSIVVNPQFASADYFSEGLARVQTTDGKYGYIDETGNYVIQPKYNGATQFSDGMAFVVTTGSSPICIDAKGEVKFSLKQVENVYAFSDGMARISDAKFLFGFVNTKGEVVVNMQYEDAKDFSEGMAAVKQKDKWGFIDEKGKLVIAPQFDNVSDFHEGKAAFFDGAIWGYIDTEGNYVINPQFNEAGDFHEGLAWVKMGEKYGFIDEEGLIKINPQFDVASDFHQGLAMVAQNDKYGFVDEAGNVKITFQFDKAADFIGGIAYIYSQEKYGLIGEDGKYITTPKFDGVKNWNEQKLSFVTSEFYDTSKFISIFFKNAKAPNQFDGIKPDGTLGDFMVGTQWVYGEIAPPFGGTSTLGRLEELQDTELTEDISMYEIVLQSREQLYTTEIHYGTDWFGRTVETGWETNLNENAHITAADYTILLADNIKNKSAVIANAIKNEFEKIYGVKFISIKDLKEKIKKQFDEFFLNSKIEIYIGWTDKGIGFIVMTWPDGTYIDISIVLGVYKQSDIEEAIGLFFYRRSRVLR